MTGMLLVVAAGSPVESDIEVHMPAFIWASAHAVRLNNKPGDFLDQPNAFLNEAALLLAEELPNIPRTTAFLEIFGGKAGSTRKMYDRGFHAYCIDRKRRSWHDVCIFTGLLYSLWMVSSVVPSGLIWISPQCSTWLQMCNGHTRRSMKNPLGEPDRRLDVREANFTSQLLWDGVLTTRVVCVCL